LDSRTPRKGAVVTTVVCPFFLAVHIQGDLTRALIELYQHDGLRHIPAEVRQPINSVEDFVPLPRTVMLLREAAALDREAARLEA
jgi:hypothetical protein